MRTGRSVLLVAVVAVIVSALMAVPIGGMQGLLAPSERAPLAGDGAQALDVGPRTVDYRWYDMFNVPFGEWYDVRWRVYANERPWSDAYPYILKHYDGEPRGNINYYTDMRLDIAGRSMPELNMNSHPEFLPYLGSARGGNATIDWYMQYLTSAELEGSPYASWNDGYIVSLNGTTTMDRQAAMAVLNVSSGGFDDFSSWWTANGNGVRTAYSAWLLSEANERLDIFNMYSYPLELLEFDLTAQKVADKITLSYDIVSWGMEALMTRWLHDAFMPTEWLFEDFRFNATIGPNMADLDISTAVAYAAYAWESTLTPGEPCWSWQAMLQDYEPSFQYHPWSDYDPYLWHSYLNLAPGSYWHDQYMQYDYTPAAWNLSAGETLSFTWPSDIVQFERHVGPDSVMNESAYMTLSYSEPNEIDLPDNVAVYDSLRTIVFSGPLDIWNWSKEQTTHQGLRDEWQRLGILPYGMPYLEFGWVMTPPPEPHEVIKGAQGPRESAVTWEYVPSAVCKWTGRIVNNGLRSLTVDIYDTTGGVSEQTSHQRIRFAASGVYPTGTVDTAEVIMGAHHAYSITVTPNGPKGSSCIVEDRFVPPEPPVATFNMTVNHTTVYVDASGSYDPDGTIMSYDWYFGDGTFASGVTATHTYLWSGIETVALTVTDNDGLFSSTSRIAYTGDSPPTASFTYSVSGTTVHVNASGSSDDYGIVSYTWHWGDGTTGSGVTASHTYAAPISMPTVSQVASGKGIGADAIPSIPPPTIFGYTYAADGVSPLPGCIVTVTNTRTGETVIWDETREYWDPDINVYVVDMSEFMNGYVIGDILNVTAIKDTLIGWTEAPVTANPDGADQIDVILSEMLGPLTVMIGLVVTDSVGQIDSMHVMVKLEVPPVASFTYTVDGLTVNVDASASSGYGIVGYDWDWGDGTTGSGMVGTHTYAASVNSTPSGPYNPTPGPPHAIFGFTYAADGVTLLTGCDVTLVNLRTGYSLTNTSDAVYGYYVVDADAFGLGWFYGDLIRVTATSGAQTGWTISLLTDSPSGYDQIDVAMGFGVATITLKVTDNNGQTASVSHTVKLVPPPIASFTLTVDGLTVNVDASASSGQGGIVSYDWDWGDGTTGTGVTATHTYALTNSLSTGSENSLTGRAAYAPHAIWGYTYAADGVTLVPGCNVTITNLRTGETLTTTSDPDIGYYVSNTVFFTLGSVYGDLLKVTATKDTLVGWTVAPITNNPNEWDRIDVTLGVVTGPIPITLTVTDTFGRTASVSMEVVLGP